MKEISYVRTYATNNSDEYSEKKSHKGVLDQLDEEQYDLISTVRAWNKEIEKKGYVN